MHKLREPSYGYAFLIFFISSFLTILLNSFFICRLRDSVYLFIGCVGLTSSVLTCTVAAILSGCKAWRDVAGSLGWGLFILCLLVFLTAMVSFEPERGCKGL